MGAFSKTGMAQIMALSLREADYLADEFKRGNL